MKHSTESHQEPVDFDLVEREVLRQLLPTMERLKPLEMDRSDKARDERRKIIVGDGLRAVYVPEDYGGRGWDLLSTIICVKTLATIAEDAAHVDGALANFIIELGTDEQKSRLLPGVADGTVVPTISITEPEAGSDATAMETLATPNGNGEYVLTGTRVFQSAVRESEVMVTFFTTKVGGGSRHIGVGLVFPGRGGVEFLEDYIDMAGTPHTVLKFTDYVMPESDVLIHERGFSAGIGVYDMTRLVSMARNLGIAESAFEDARSHLLERKQFGRALGEFQGLQWMLADMAIELEASKLMLYKAAVSVMRREDDAPLHASMAKTFVSERIKNVCDTAIQLLGGYGYMKEWPTEYKYRVVRGSSIYGGTAQIHRNMIASRLLGKRFSQREQRFIE